MGIRLTGYGRREWLGATAAAWVVCALLIWGNNWLLLLPAGLVLVVWLWVLWFFRDPDRAVPRGPGLLVSPADGQVADITQVGPDSVLGCAGVKIGVFMNVFNVHVNRSPAEARVERIEHADGLYLDARHPDAADRNESTTIYLTYRQDGRDYPLVVRQISGLIARRIVTDLQVGQELARGERIGMIKFGSRLELFVPAELAGQVAVEVGRKVLAGATVLVEARGDGGDE